MTVKTAALTCVMRNLVSLSGSRPFSLDRIISSMSPWSFSITTNTFSGVSNMHSRFTIPKCRRLWERMKGQDKEMLGWVSHVVAYLHSWPNVRCPHNQQAHSRFNCVICVHYHSVNTMALISHTVLCVMNHWISFAPCWSPAIWLLHSSAGSPAWWGTGACRSPSRLHPGQFSCVFLCGLRKWLCVVYVRSFANVHSCISLVVLAIAYTYDKGYE